eukprot:1016398_1
MDLQNIDTINTPNASQMLDTNNTVSHPTIQCLLYEVFFNTIYLNFTPKHLLLRQDQPLYPSSVLQRVICTLFYVQFCVTFMHRARVNLKPLRMMNVNNDPSSVNTRITSLLENYLKPQNVLFVQAIPTVMHTNAINTLNALNTHDGIPRNFAPIEIEFEFESQNTTDLTSMTFSWRILQQRHETSRHTLRHHLGHKKHHYSRANLRKIATTTHRTLSFNSNASFGTVFSVRYLCTFGLYSLLMCLTFLLLFYCDCVVFFFVLFCYFYISITFLSLLLLVLLSLIYDHTWRVYKYDTPHYRYYLNLFHLLLFHLLMLFCIYFICLYLNVSSSLCHARVYIISTFCILYITVVFWSNNILAKEPDDTKCVPSLHCIQRKANPAFWICQTGSYITYLMNMEMAKVVHTQLRKDLKFLQ